jgi:glycosyltransferase involved in cell wall biosynthesis/SAM-dependent methyltransferase
MTPAQCWCGNTALGDFGPDYLHCGACETLVARAMPGDEISRVHDDDADFYGREYWFSHQQADYGLPSILERARSDLPERCLYWLRTLLKYRLPPADVLECGSAHGGFVAMLRWAGFAATGLELSPWVAEFGRRTFEVPMLVGPIEDQSLAPGSLDMIAAMDVLEHLPDPMRTVRHCLSLLRPGGMLLLQTPRYPERVAYETLVADDSPFLMQLKATDHLYLFSETSVRAFLAELRVSHIVFEPAIFAQYDMFLLAGHVPPVAQPSSEIALALTKSPGGRLVQALLDLDGRLRESEADRAARLVVIEQLAAALDARDNSQLPQPPTVATAAVEDAPQASTQWSASDRSDAGAADLEPVGSSELPAAWGGPRLLAAPRPTPAPAPRADGSLRRVAVDLLPLLPGAENGGAKIFVLALLRELSRLAADCEFVLLTNSATNEELAALDAPNVRRVTIVAEGEQMSPPATGADESQDLGLALYHLAPDVLYCPFHMPGVYNPAIPLVVTIYDLQYRYYPQFFTEEQRFYRDEAFLAACELADKLVCISEHTRQQVLENSDLGPDTVVAVPISLADRWHAPNELDTERLLEQLQLQRNRFLLYPANFWPHKNHRVLLAAFELYQALNPGSDLKLVCSGFPDDRMEAVRAAARAAGLGDQVVFPGFLPDEQFAALLDTCLALIFPSLFEGFGIPVIEAMKAGIPVLCSGVTSLLEVAGDAAILFDPTRPLQIAQAIERIERDPALRRDLSMRAYQRLGSLPDEATMARMYLEALRAAACTPKQFACRAYGIYDDGWTAERVVITFPESPVERYLEVVVLPHLAGRESVTITLRQDSVADSATYLLTSEQPLALHRPLPLSQGFIELQVQPALRPLSYKGQRDYRRLGVRCGECRVVSASGVIDLLHPPRPAPDAATGPT